MFPSHESDFFRNRLTHSLEVAQVAKSIALRLNDTEQFLSTAAMKIDSDLVEFAALAHDIGHPPFGHNGEAALDSLMLDAGGFEGNAQTLRIIARLEKKHRLTDTKGDKVVDDPRFGINPTARTIASILKYDEFIPVTEENRRKDGSEKLPKKGVYFDDKPIIDFVKSNIDHGSDTEFKTLECHIMDTADDIAYSTYDIEDAIKSGFITPIRLVAADDRLKQKVAEQVESKCHAIYDDKPVSHRSFSVNDLNNILFETFRSLFELDEPTEKRVLGGSFDMPTLVWLLSTVSERASNELCEDGYVRTEFTSHLVGEYIRNVEFIENSTYPSQSKVRLNIDVFKRVEALKRFVFTLLIESPRFKIAERRGKEIIELIFRTLSGSPELLPADWGHIYELKDSSEWQSRVICDYIAGMTDKYCVEIYARLTGENPMTIWKPH